MFKKDKKAGFSLIFLLILSFAIIIGLIGILIPEFLSRANMPHVILISLDTLKRSHLGIYGYPKNISPNIDEFSRKANVFLRAYSQSSWTKPGHASMLTGHYSLTHKLLSSRKTGKFNILPRKIKIMAEILKKEGYRTIGVTDGGYVHGKYGFSRGFQVYRDKKKYGIKKNLEYLKKKIERGKKPYFLFIHTYDIHGPYGGGDIPPYTNSNYDGKFKGCVGDPEKFYNLYSKVLLGKLRITEGDIDYIIENYDHCIKYVDRKLGEFFDFLKKKNMWRNALIIITSDHGERHNPLKARDYQLSRFRYFIGHIGFSALLVKVPLIIKLPFQKKPYYINRSVSAGIDILPTVLEVLHIETNMKLPGKSVLADNDKHVFFSKLNCGLGLIKDEKYIIFKRQNLEQLPTTEKGPYSFNAEKYKVVSDGISIELGEKIVKQRIEIINEMNRFYLEHKDAKQKELDKNLLEQLKALGYL